MYFLKYASTVYRLQSLVVHKSTPLIYLSKPLTLSLNLSLNLSLSLSKPLSLSLNLSLSFTYHLRTVLHTYYTQLVHSPTLEKSWREQWRKAAKKALSLPDAAQVRMKFGVSLVKCMQV